MFYHSSIKGVSVSPDLQSKPAEPAAEFCFESVCWGFHPPVCDQTDILVNKNACTDSNRT